MRLDQYKHLLARRQQAYQQVLRGPQAEIVIADLAQFCRALESTFDIEPLKTANMEGRREVFLRIFENLHMSLEELLEIKLGDSNAQQAIVNRSIESE